MTNRREFLQIGIAASAWPIAARATAMTAIKGETASRSVVSFYKAVFDSRYQDSQRFADQMSKQNVPIHGMTGDITPFWFKELDAQWKKEPVAIAGMTAHGPLFCLERLAWDQGLRVVYRAEHKLHLNSAIIEHRLSGPQTMIDKGRAGVLALGGLDTHWSTGVAKLMMECPVGHTAIDQVNLMAPLSRNSEDSDQVDAFADPLISWVIAPAKKA